MERSLRGRRELHDATCGERRKSEGSSLFPNGPLGGNEGEWVLRGNRALKAGYRHNVESHVVLFVGLPEGTIFRDPLDQEFFYPIRSSAMADTSRFASCKYVVDGSVIPRGIATPEGFDGGSPSTLGGCSSARGPRFSFCGEVMHDAGML